MKMFNQLLHLHWRAVRWPLAPFVLLSFGLPMLVTRVMQVPRGFMYGTGSIAGDLVQMETGWLPVFPLLAVVIGVTLALTAWSWDHQGRHVYALSLPVTRGRYALLKMGAGLILMLIPVAALLAGTVLGIALTKLPPELHGYPLSFTLRFFLGAAITYAATFAVASTTVRTTVFIFVGLITFFLFGSIVVLFVGEALHQHYRTPIELLYDAMLNWAGPFNVFGGSWLFIDA